MTLAELRRANEFVFTFVDEISRGGGNPGWCWETTARLPRNLAETTILVSCVASLFCLIGPELFNEPSEKPSSGPLRWKKDRVELRYQATQFSGSLLCKRLQQLLPFLQLMVKVGRRRTITKQNCFPQLRKSPSLYYFFPL